jgi:hypothetical protein
MTPAKDTASPRAKPGPWQLVMEATGNCFFYDNDQRPLPLRPKTIPEN